MLVFASVHSRLDYCNYSVFHSLSWSRFQLLQSVLNSAARLNRGLGQLDHITHVSIECQWIHHPSVCLTRSVCLCSKCLKGSPMAYAYLTDLCVGTASVPGLSGLRSAVRGNRVLLLHWTEWGSMSFAVAGPKC